MEGAAEDDRTRDRADDRADGGGPIDLGRLAEVERELASVEHALGRLDAGTWGSCEACGVAIDPATLAEDPGARTCPAHR